MIEKRDFLYTPKGKNRPLHIYLPNDYYASDRRYPVMYFFDGHNLYRDRDATYGKSWGLETFLNSWWWPATPPPPPPLTPCGKPIRT